MEPRTRPALRCALAAAAAHALALPLAAMSPAQEATPGASAAPLTAAEASGWTRTSTALDVSRFLDGLAALPRAALLTRDVLGASEEDRLLTLVTAEAPLRPADPPDPPRLRVFVNANIHGGEVEGKEAVQMLLREIASGEHAELLEHLVLHFVPVYNADGNERIERRHRSDQNGPEGGVGTRENARGLDLNRDFVKARSVECRALLGAFRRLDPHVFVDLHTTNGSHHGYHLTYSPSLSTNVDEELDGFTRGVLLSEARAGMLERHGYRVFDYGNFSEEGERRWETYDHRPRFGTNYFGLRNRIAVLSEAYSYLDFEARVRVTRAFVLEVLAAAARHRARIAALCAAADERLRAGEPPVLFGWDSALAAPVPAEVLVGSVERIELDGGLGTRIAALPDFETVEMPVQTAFESRRRAPLPFAWAIPEPEPAVLELLALHGVEHALLAAPAEAALSAFHPSALLRAERSFQQIHEIRLEGEWHEESRLLAPGTLIVPARQALGRLAAQLLEPESEDSLSTWGFFERRTRAAAEGASGGYPVLRLEAQAVLELAPLEAR